MSLASVARNIVKGNLFLKESETFVVVTDTSREPIGRALFEAGLSVGADSQLIVMRERERDAQEPPRPVAEAMRACDVFAAPARYSLTHTQARIEATEAGARGTTMPGITEKVFSGGAMAADYSEIDRRIKRAMKFLAGKKRAHVTTPAGTDIDMPLSPKMWKVDIGIINKRGIVDNLPAGEVYCAPTEGAANGVYVVDGSQSGMPGGVVKRPIRITVEDGFATKIENAGPMVKTLREAAAKLKTNKNWPYNIAELGIGMNQGARIVGSPLEDEKVLGTVHIAVGTNASFGGTIRAGVHLDGIMRRPTLEVDGKVMIDDGKLLV